MVQLDPGDRKIFRCATGKKTANSQIVLHVLNVICLAVNFSRIYERMQYPRF